MQTSTITLATLAGVCAAAPAQPETMAPGRFARGVPMGNIYYNVRTGERAVTPFVPGARDGSLPLWLNNNSDPCATRTVVGVIDDPDSDGDTCGDLWDSLCPGGTFPLEGMWNNFWGDIAHDTVVDCVRIAYGIRAPDTDTNLDGVGDGIVGYDMYVSFADADNGFGADGSDGRRCISSITVPTLPGAVGDLGEWELAVYFLTLDFGGATPSLMFELGDSDGIDDAGTGRSGAAIHGAPTYRDIDGDTLGDFSWAISFDQSSLPVPGEGPGRTKGANGFLSVAAKLGNPGDLPPHPADATGIEDVVDIYWGPICSPNSGDTLIGTFYFGGFRCDGEYPIPYTSAWLELYGHAGDDCGPADLAPPFGVLDYSDVLAFLIAFADCHDAADLAAPSGVCDFSDVTLFLTTLSQGCP